MKNYRFFPLLITFILSIVGLSPLAYLVYLKISENKPYSILVECDEYVYPGQNITLKPTVLDKYNNILLDQEISYSSSNDSIVYFENDESASFKVSDYAQDGERIVLTLKSGDAKKDILLTVKEGLFEIISVDVNQRQDIYFNETYTIDIKSIPLDVKREFINIRALNLDGEEKEGYVDISDDDFLITTIGVGEVLLEISSTIDFKNREIISTIPLNITFKDEYLRDSLPSNLTHSQIEDIIDIELNIDSPSYDLSNLEGFNNLSTLTLNISTFCELNNYSGHYDVLVPSNLFETYELSSLDTSLKQNIFPVIDSFYEHLIIYYVNTVNGNQKIIRDYKNNSTLLEKEETGYTFIDWFSYDGDIVESMANLDKRERLYARYEANEYVIDFDINGGNETYQSKTIKYGEVIDFLSTPTNDVAQFLGWYDEDGNYFENGTVFLLNKNITLKAMWRTDLLIYFDTNGGNTLSPISINYGQTITGLDEKIPSRDYAQFKYWSYEGNIVEEGDTFLYNHDITLLANYDGSYLSIDDFNEYKDNNQDLSISTIDLTSFINGEAMIVVPNYIDELTLLNNNVDEINVTSGILVEERTNPLTLNILNVNLVMDEGVLNINNCSDLTINYQGNINLFTSSSNGVDGDNLTLSALDINSTITFNFNGVLSYTKSPFKINNLTVEDNSKVLIDGTSSIPSTNDDYLMNVNEQLNIGNHSIFEVVAGNSTSINIDGMNALKVEQLTLNEYASISIKAGDGFGADAYLNRARDGGNGTGGSSDGADGTNGLDGEDGENGLNGSSTGIGLVANDITLSKYSSLSILSSKAGDGQDGQDGGNGGEGGDGAKGKNNGTIFSKGGAGGDGGDGGDGGNGGNGGDGGDGKTNLIVNHFLIVEDNVTINIYENKFGNPGSYGNGGAYGSAGSGGAGGSGGFLGSKGSSGASGINGTSGVNGNIGISGTTSIAFDCYNIDLTQADQLSFNIYLNPSSNIDNYQELNVYSHLTFHTF